ncbi:MAG: hypothetical protein EG823_04080, partial [Actinobacteria bacterium]|nr:hypothetical protein [Actinomycetota bacterium]
MAVAGFCSQCGQNVFLDDKWSCPKGHGWNAVTSWYDTTTGQPVAPPWQAPQAATAAAPAPTPT